MSELAFTHFGREGVEVGEELITRLYVITHGDVIGNPFYSADRFVERVHGYARSPGFELVIGAVEGDPVGLALGYSLPTNAKWWNGLTTPVDPDFIAEDGTRTFGLCEIMTHPGWQGRGIAHQVHDELLYKRPERRATLLVREENETARAAYFKWGWRQIGKLRPFPDAPHYDALVLDLAES
ncbi:GNAT family N-acetyltransferase [Pseudonocardia spinosispora]|uniref:GNAT family N-acetyltransferase n=1 Tax=Pseudonocardia spinosispora TaxID=103441 RepID=UPI0004209916|nr:GNAT family N-acetyltransferase [Pseudonocardia spinosispora]